VCVYTGNEQQLYESDERIVQDAWNVKPNIHPDADETQLSS